MKPSTGTWPRITAARVRAIKAGLVICLATIFHYGSSAQCNNNLGTRSYDTTFSGSSYNAVNVKFPMWNPDSGLLVSAKLSSEVSSQYSFTLGNVDSHPTTFLLLIGQQEQFASPQLGATFTGSYPPQLIGTYPLAPGQSISQAPFTFLDKHVTSDSITGAVAPFLGTGQVNISYTSFTYTTLSSYPSSYYSYGADIYNTMKFSLQYLYCKGSGGTLATNLTRWTARLQQPRTVQLDWSAVNETVGRVYHVQRSTDGQSFNDIAVVPARNDNNPDYSLSDILPATSPGSPTSGLSGSWTGSSSGSPTGVSSGNSTGGLSGSPTGGPNAGNFYYRLLIDDQGSVSYSTIQQVSLNADARGIKVYPNPATDFISVNTGSAGNWQVDILAADGSLVQRESFLQASTMRVNFRSRMSAGTYFVRAFDLRGQRNFTSTFIVTGH